MTSHISDVAPPYSLDGTVRLLNLVEWALDATTQAELVDRTSASIKTAVVINIDQPALREFAIQQLQHITSALIEITVKPQE